MHASRTLYWHISIWGNSYWYAGHLPFYILFSYTECMCTSGMKRFPAGRMGDAPARGLSQSLAQAGFELGRLQTGTPARLDARTVNLKGMEVQEGDIDPSPFSFLNATIANRASHSLLFREWAFIDLTQDNQVACYKTYTTSETHRLIRESMHLSVHIQETKKGEEFC
jgi:tRNA uridine 5-carboxymethylaminomethyl modification enzyme